MIFNKYKIALHERMKEMKNKTRNEKRGFECGKAGELLDDSLYYPKEKKAAKARWKERIMVCAEKDEPHRSSRWQWTVRAAGESSHNRFCYSRHAAHSVSEFDTPASPSLDCLERSGKRMGRTLYSGLAGSVRWPRSRTEKSFLTRDLIPVNYFSIPQGGNICKNANGIWVFLTNREEELEGVWYGNECM